MKYIKRISSSTLAILLIGSFLSPVNANSKSNIELENSFQTRQIVEKKLIETNEDELFNLAKDNVNDITLDENGNEVYRVSQLEEVALSKTGETIKTYTDTTFSKVEDDSNINVRASITHDGWDKTNSAFTKSTINYSILGSSLKLNSCSGSVSRLNSGVRVQNLTVTIGCTSPLHTNQKTTKNYGTSTSFSYTTPSSWKPVPNKTSGSASSIVGCSMRVKLGRSSSSTWTQHFVNNVDFHSNN